MMYSYSTITSMMNSAGVRVRPESPVGRGDRRGKVMLARLCNLFLEESEA